METVDPTIALARALTLSAEAAQNLLRVCPEANRADVGRGLRSNVSDVAALAEGTTCKHLRRWKNRAEAALRPLKRAEGAEPAPAAKPAPAKKKRATSKAKPRTKLAPVTLEVVPF